MFTNFASYIFVKFIYFPFKFYSYEWCLSVGKFVIKVFYPLAKKHRKIAFDNISHAFPELSEEEKLELVKKHFLHIGVLMADSLYAPRVDHKWLEKYAVYDDDSLEIEKRTRENGEGVVLISGHFGSWELLVHYLGYKFQGLGIYKKIKNPYINKWYKDVREASGIELVSTEEPSSIVAKQLKKGRWIGFGADQNAGNVGIFVNFLNRPASTFQGPALMAYLTGARMLLYSFVKDKENKVHIRVKDLGVIDKKKYSDKKEAIRFYTELWTKTLEEEIKKFPEQYFWVHRRWKTKPGDFPEMEYPE
ncbi:MAG: lauroyl acyltransferase [Leptospiraceae bacterium]|nr:lauroyl acyltransferase [Leptospiraceae bacterium]MCP5495505.1 lauroyl acyltransferase [Leptospiraceae bacterium]